MENFKYQSWEGEMEIQMYDENEPSIGTVVISTVFGIVLLVTLLIKTAVTNLIQPANIGFNESRS
jgi:hypothetical protein